MSQNILSVSRKIPRLSLKSSGRISASIEAPQSHLLLHIAWIEELRHVVVLVSKYLSDVSFISLVSFWKGSWLSSKVGSDIEMLGKQIFQDFAI